MKNPSRFTFDSAAEHVYTLLLKKDCYPRFIRSDQYRNLLAAGVQPLQKKRQALVKLRVVLRKIQFIEAPSVLSDFSASAVKRRRKFPPLRHQRLALCSTLIQVAAADEGEATGACPEAPTSSRCAASATSPPCREFRTPTASRISPTSHTGMRGLGAQGWSPRGNICPTLFGRIRLFLRFQHVIHSRGYQVDVADDRLIRARRIFRGDLPRLVKIPSRPSPRSIQ